MKLSCYILTRNSDRRLEEVLSSIVDAVDELVILDSGSTDQTQSIAETYGARFHFREFDDFRSQRNFALSLCKHDWVLELDSDEVVSPALATRISDLKHRAFHFDKKTPDGFSICREWFLLGKKLNCFYPLKCPDYPVRLYQRNKVNYNVGRGIHEAPVGYKTVERIHEPILHYTCDTIDQMYAKINQYTTLLAREMYLSGQNVGWVKIFLYPWLIWFRYYVLFGGFKDGELGLIHGRYVRETVWLKMIKLKYDFSSAKMRKNSVEVDSE